MKPLRVLLVGSGGRMGLTIAELAQNDPAIDVVGLCDLGDPIEPALSHCDVVIDFSHADAIGEICTAVSRHKKALVVGTTGHTEVQRKDIGQCAQSVAIVFSSNYSVGVNVLFWLTRKATSLLGPDFDVEIVEMHHRLKKDAPSGTALSLAKILQEQRDLPNLRHGRHRVIGERTETEPEFIRSAEVTSSAITRFFSRARVNVWN